MNFPDRESEKKKSEELQVSQMEEIRRLKETQAQLVARVRKFITGFPFGLIILRCDQTIKAVNKIAVEYFGYHESELAQKQISVLFPGTERFDRDQPIKPLKARRKIGTDFNVEACVNVLDIDGEELFFISIQDIDERTRLEELRQDLVAMVTHDLRQPLTTLRITLEMINEGIYGDLSTRGRDLVEHGVSSIGYLNSLVENLLESEKLKDGSIKLTYKETTVGRIANRAINATAVPGARIETDLNNDVITVDEERLVQVLINLISNAMKYADGTVVRVKGTIEGTNVRFEVEDEGPGIPEDLRVTIFDRFKQLERSDNPKKRGYGLGLFICKSLIELHGGRIWVEDRTETSAASSLSTSGGSRFCFVVPASTSEHDR